MPPEASPLPLLRLDLEIAPGPRDETGAPGWVLHDPVRGTFDRVTWAQMEVIRRLKRYRSPEALADALAAQTTLRWTPEEVRELAEDLVRKNLARGRPVRDPSALLRESARQPSWVARAFRSYLFFRIPLWKPDRFLTWTLPLVRILTLRPVAFLWCAATMAGFVMLLQQAPAYLHTFPSFFDARGAGAYLLAVAGARLVHEFGHAWTAKAYGLRVPRMGLAFLFLYPVPYCDVTDAWRLQKRSRRIAVSGAGVVVEVALAGVALFFWGVLPPGAVRDGMFVLSSATLLSTLLVNLNPAMRYDGYYLLADLLRIDNLRPRAQVALRHAWRKTVFGIRHPDPDPELSEAGRRTLLLYAAGAWAYRLVLYTGIAAFVYGAFAKVVGLCLLAGVVLTLLVVPLLREALTLWRLRDEMTLRAGGMAVGLGGLLLLAWAGAPLPRRVDIPAVLESRAARTVYAPASGRIAEVAVERGARVSEGATLLRIEAEALESRWRLVKLDLERERLLLRDAAHDPEARAFLPRIREEVARLEARAAGLREALDACRITTDLAGTVVALDETLRVGRPVAEGAALGRIARPESRRLVAYLPEARLGDLEPGAEGVFRPYATGEALPVRVERIRRVRSMHLRHPALGSDAGGPLPVRRDAAGRRRLDESLYEVTCLPSGREPDGLRPGMTGRFWFRTPPRSLLAGAGRHLEQVLLRESAF